MRIREDEEEGSGGVNLTPMIDVVFLLIIFFMVSTSFIELEKELEIDLPEAASGETRATPRPEIVVNVQEDGGIALDGEEVGIEALTYRLERAVEEDPEQPVTIRGDREVAYDNVVRVIDACRIAKVRNLAVTARDKR